MPEKENFLNSNYPNSIMVDTKFKKGHIPWSKGKKRPEISGKNNPMFGKKHSKKIREQMSDSHKGKKGYWLGKKGLKKSHMKGISLEEEYGLDRAKEIKDKIAEKNKGKRYSIKTEFKIGQERSDKWKEWRKKYISPKKDTSIEVKIQNYLKTLGVDFFTHQYMKEIEHGYQCDILIPVMDLIIEVDGDYWHKYPVGNDLDHIRTKELINKGFKVLRLWEREIKAMSLDDFKKRLEGDI